MGNLQLHNEKQIESAICESDLGFELLDMLAQANIDFRRLPQEELRHLMATFRPHPLPSRRRSFALSSA